MKPGTNTKTDKNTKTHVSKKEIHYFFLTKTKTKTDKKTKTTYQDKDNPL